MIKFNLWPLSACYEMWARLPVKPFDQFIQRPAKVVHVLVSTTLGTEAKIACVLYHPLTIQPYVPRCTRPNCGHILGPDLRKAPGVGRDSLLASVSCDSGAATKKVQIKNKAGCQPAAEKKL